jgi:hypothetical protein
MTIPVQARFHGSSSSPRHMSGPVPALARDAAGLAARLMAGA